MNFNIENNGIVSEAFLKIKITSFKEACEWMASRPYQRNANKSNILCVLEEGVGTCSTKHATLRKLALENDHKEVELILGIFKMDAEYAPKIAQTLKLYNRNFIIEAHMYLKIRNAYFDFTNPNSKYEDFQHKLIEEYEWEYNRIDKEKIEKHKAVMVKWEDIKTIEELDELWGIREKCIYDLQKCT